MTYVPPPLIPRLKSRLRKRIVDLRHRLRLARDGKEIFDHCRFFGADFIVRLDDHIGYEMAIGIFEWVQLDRLIKTCERIKPDVFLDIGAHSGLYTCVIGRRDLAKRLDRLRARPPHAREPESQSPDQRSARPHRTA